MTPTSFHHATEWACTMESDRLWFKSQHHLSDVRCSTEGFFPYGDYSPSPAWPGIPVKSRHHVPSIYDWYPTWQVAGTEQIFSPSLLTTPEAPNIQSPNKHFRPFKSPWGLLKFLCLWSWKYTYDFLPPYSCDGPLLSILLQLLGKTQNVGRVCTGLVSPKASYRKCFLQSTSGPGRRHSLTKVRSKFISSIKALIKKDHQDTFC